MTADDTFFCMLSNFDMVILIMCSECRNELRAVEHYRRHLLAHAVAAWRLYVVVTQRERETEQVRLATQNKMAAFLDAAASGRLWTDRTTEAVSDNAQVAKDEVNADGQMIGGGRTVTYISSRYHAFL